MPQTSKVSRNNTTIARHPDGSLKRVTLHQTVILEMGPVREDGSRVLAISNGGWNTVTTQTRLNQCFREAGLPIRYSRAKGIASIRFLTRKGYILSASGCEWDTLELSGGNALLDVLQIGHGQWLTIVRPSGDKFVVVN